MGAADRYIYNRPSSLQELLSELTSTRNVGMLEHVKASKTSKTSEPGETEEPSVTRKPDKPSEPLWMALTTKR